MIEIPTGYIIRRANQDDVPQIARLRVAMQSEERPSQTIGLDYLEATANSFSELMAANSYRGWLAFSENETRAVAVAGYLVHAHPPKPERWQQSRAYVTGVYTEPHHRRKGLARALMQHIEEHARSLGFRRLELRASEQGRPLYLSMGFVPQEVLMLELDRNK